MDVAATSERGKTGNRRGRSAPAKRRVAAATRRSTNTGLLAFIFGAMMTIPVAHAENRVLHIANRPDFIDDDTIQKFEAESGVTVTYDTDAEDEGLLAQLKLKNPRRWDLAVMPSRLLASAIAEHLLQPIDHRRLSNFGNLSPEILTQTALWDPGNRFDIPYLWGSAGLAINNAKLHGTVSGRAIDSLSSIFESPTLSCGVAVEDDASDVMPAMYLSLGLDPASASRDDLKAVEERLIKLKSSVRRLPPDEFSDALADGRLCLGFGASTDIEEAKLRAEDRETGADLAYLVPKEGTRRWIDVLVLPAQSTHAAEALAFIDYVLRPEVSAEISDWTRAASPNLLAADFMAADPEDQAVFPSEATRAAMIPDLVLTPENEIARARVWEKTAP